MASPPGELTTLVTRLAAARVDFVLVGALAAVAQGAPLTTHDVDIVHNRDPDNVERLVAFLASTRGTAAGRAERSCGQRATFSSASAIRC
jgi:hypothetical protein